MTALVSDSFNRAATTASATALGNADTGQTWKQEGNLYFYINSNGQAQGSGNESFAAVNASASDVDVSCDIIPYATSANAGIAIRNDGSSGNVSLFLRINGLNYEFYEQGATTSKLASQSASYSAGQTITLRMVAQGSTVTCYANGVQLFGQSFTVTENQTNTYHGLRFLDTSSADNFVINSVGGSSPTPINATGAFQGQGSLSATANIVNPNPLVASASITAPGTIASTPMISSPAVLNAFASFNGSSSLSSSPTMDATVVTASASIQGTSSMDANGQVVASPVIAYANFQGQGTLTTNAIQDIIASASFAGSSYLMTNPVLPATLNAPKVWDTVFDPKKLWSGQFSPSKKVWTAKFETSKTWIVGFGSDDGTWGD